MYDWLDEALGDGSSQVVTGNRRLARSLCAAWSEVQVAAGRTAWKSPAVHSWEAWLVRLAESAIDEGSPFARISDTQSRVLWEACLAEDLSDPFLNIPRLARQCLHAWKRLHEWRVPAPEWQSRAVGQDQRIFARAAERYADLLAASAWTDSAGLPERLATRIGAGQISVPERLVLCGFDRLTPQASMLVDACRAAGSSISHMRSPVRSSAPVVPYATVEAELRAAGAWAAARVRQDPEARVAIVANQLDSQADRIAALIREGAVPGWQYGPGELAEAVNVSYGRTLADYPAIAIALLLLRWMFGPLRAADVSLLLRSLFVGPPELADRCRFELLLRNEPDRDWTLQMLGRFLRRRSERAAAPALHGWLESCESARRALDVPGARQRPSGWAQSLESALAAAGWPGAEPLSSRDFQLDNRWRQLLNEFARLDAVSDPMPGAEAVVRLASLARDSIFQPEAGTFAVSLLGPLEAAGLEFDALWLTGASSDEWPPPAKPLALVSRDVQRDFAMPDAVPEDTTTHARTVIHRLAGSAPLFVASYAEAVADAEQLPTSLLAATGSEDLPADLPADPGWHAHALVGSAGLVPAADRVPPVGEEERIGGGAYTIEYQRHDPFSAFAYGRLGIGQLSVFTTGIAPNVRGNIVHAALQHFYRDRVSQRAAREWPSATIEARLDESLQAAFGRYRADADSLLQKLLAIEQKRTARLLRRVLENDLSRDEFVVANVEPKLDARLGDIRLSLRCDRIDLDGSGRAIILDYKTGSPRRLLVRGEVRELQLVVYSCVLSGQIAGLGLYNVDSREVAIDGAGPAFDEGGDWAATLEGWQAEVMRLAREIAGGDVRINARQGLEDARHLSLLSRFPEVQREF